MVNNWYCEINYRGKVHKAFAKDERDALGIREKYNSPLQDESTHEFREY